VCDLSGTHVFGALDAVGPLDYVIHLAAQSYVHSSLIRPDVYVQNNVLATSNLVQALASQPSLKRFVLVSSCEVYGNTHSPAAETHRLKPRTHMRRASWPRNTLCSVQLNTSGYLRWCVVCSTIMVRDNRVTG
jgi:nucleoside-diphosphate-sugar epimerase